MRILTMTTALALIHASGAGAVPIEIQAMPLPVLGATACSTGGGGVDPLEGSNCVSRVSPAGDVAVWGTYDNGADRSTVNAGVSEHVLHAGSARLEFDLDSDDRLFVDSSSLFLFSDNGWSEMTVGKNNSGSTSRVSVGPNALIQMNSRDTAAIMRIGDNGNGKVDLYESGIELKGNTLSYMQLGVNGGSGELSIGTNTIGRGSTVYLMPDGGGDAAMELGVDGIGVVNVGSGELKLAAGQGNAIMALGTDGGSGTLTLDRLGSQVRLVSSTGDARLVAGASAGGSGTINVQGGNLGMFDAGFTSEIILGANNVDPFGAGAGTTGPGGTGTLNVSGVSATEMGSVFANTLYVGVSGADAGMPDGGTGILNVGANGIVEADEMYVGQIQQAGGGNSAGHVQITNGGQVDLFGGNSQVIVGANGSVLVDGDGSVLRSDEITLTGSATNDAVLKVGNKGVVDLRGGDLVVQTGGVLMGSKGSILGDVILDGGSLRPGASPGILDIAGDLTLTSGVLELEFAGTGEGQYDILNIAGNLFLPENSLASVVVKFLDGFTPGTNDSFQFLNVAGTLPESFASVDVSFEGLSGPAPSLFTNGIGNFALAFADPYAQDEDPVIGAVPLPAGAWLLITAFGGLAGLRSRRRRKAAFA